jgi:DNA-binding CsgD family transcriptional regulator
MSNGHRPGSTLPGERTPECVARLTPGQLDCLVLVNQHYSSKEIAAELGISRHTVDQRIRQALQRLGVDRRSEAARIACSAGALPAYQQLIHQPPHIDAATDPGDQVEAVSHQIRHADRAGGIRSAGVITEQASSGAWSSLPLPFATRSHPRNEMSVGLRLLWIVLIAMGATFSAGMYLAGLESLSRMLG